MAAYERQGGFDGYAARASRGYAAREGLYSAKGYKAATGDKKDDGWRLSDRLYELSLDAEAREARQKAQRGRAQGPARRRGARDRAPQSRAGHGTTENARSVRMEARLLKDQTRDARDDFVKELVALRHEVRYTKKDGSEIAAGGRRRRAVTTRRRRGRRRRCSRSRARRITRGCC